ncbi:gallinacin-8-like [Anas acuta]|uniref:gallinacin-8-like n=1 Tax=Anas acuta TaxID=28680 RepID=UPI0035C8BCC0
MLWVRWGWQTRIMREKTKPCWSSLAGQEGHKDIPDGTCLKLLYLVPLHSDMKIIYLFFAVLLLVLQSSLGFMRAPNNAVQCKQAGGTCSTDHCPPPNTRAFGRCKQGIPCCRTVYD